MSGPGNNSVVVWRILDGKPGHESQTLGLVNALKRSLHSVDVYEIPAAGKGVALWYWSSARFPLATGLPDPDLIVGAGHSTHLTLLAARRARGGLAVVLMQPSMPMGWFDLCIVPEHDGVESCERIFLTRGVLNPLSSAGVHHRNRGLILIGGPSTHYDWDGGAVVRQVKEMVEASPEISFDLTTSRRTPGDFVSRVSDAEIENVNVVPVEDTGPGWVAEKLAESSVAWVTEDSVSMVYESLTAGVEVGLLSVPEKSESRVSRGLSCLVKDGLVTDFVGWKEHGFVKSADMQFSESDRCAEWIVSKL